MSFRNIRGTWFPSPAAQNTAQWSNYADRVDIPALVLMENMAVETGGGAGSHVAFVATNNLDLLLAPPPTQQSTEVVNSQVGLYSNFNTLMLFVFFRETLLDLPTLFVIIIFIQMFILYIHNLYGNVPVWASDLFRLSDFPSSCCNLALYNRQTFV